MIKTNKKKGYKVKGYKVIISDEVKREIALAPDDVKEQIAQLIDDFKTGKKDPAKVGEPVKLRKLTFEIICDEEDVEAVKRDVCCWDATLISDDMIGIDSFAEGICNKITVPKDCCYLRFTDNPSTLIDASASKHVPVRYDHSDPDFETVRGEHMIVDYDEHNLVIGVELLGSKQAKKRCQ